MCYPTDPYTLRTFEPVFVLERIYNATIFDSEGNEIPCVISYWLSEDGEVKEVKVNIKDTQFSDFNYDVRECIYKKHGDVDIIGEIERI